MTTSPTTNTTILNHARKATHGGGGGERLRKRRINVFPYKYPVLNEAGIRGLTRQQLEPSQPLSTKLPSNSKIIKDGCFPQSSVYHRLGRVRFSSDQCYPYNLYTCKRYYSSCKRYYSTCKRYYSSRQWYYCTSNFRREVVII
ncbi:hypothetical protein M8J76_004681 [Diaphorina citri]|nr:hypothetical protein M8J76_004681 [Diaphorina citri]